MADRVLIKGGTVLSLDRAVGNMVDADVLIEDGIIAEVGTSLRARDAEVVDATDTIVMPGFVDAHRRLWQSLARNAGTTSGADRSADYTPDDVYAATLVGLLRALEAGITTVVDWCDVSGDAAHLEAALPAHADSGVRTVFVPPGSVGARRPSRHHGRVRLPRRRRGASWTRSTLRWAQAREAGRRIHARAGTAAAAGGEVAELGRRGLLGPDVTLCHCTRLSAADFDAVAASSTAVALTPASDMARGVGPPPMQQLIDRGIRPGLGVGDRAARARRCLRPDARRHLRAARHDVRPQAGRQGRAAQPARDPRRHPLRHHRRREGRRALGRSPARSSPGKRADVIVLRADRPNIAPVNDPIGAVVWGMDTSNVDWVFVGGAALVAHGELTADVARARALAVAAQRQRRGRSRRARRRRSEPMSDADALRRRPHEVRRRVALHAGVPRPGPARRRRRDLGPRDAQPGRACRRSPRSPPCSRSPPSARCW